MDISFGTNIVEASMHISRRDVKTIAVHVCDLEDSNSISVSAEVTDGAQGERVTIYFDKEKAGELAHRILAIINDDVEATKE